MNLSLVWMGNLFIGLGKGGWVEGEHFQSPVKVIPLPTPSVS